MNDRIKELAEQAKAEIRSEEEIEGVAYDNFDEQVMKKFAELIIKECIVQCQSNSPDVDRYSDEYDNGVDFGVKECVLSIKTQFGVK